MRRLAASDAEIVRQIRAAAARESPESIYPTAEEMLAMPISELQSKLAQRHGYVLGAFDEAELIGIAGLRGESYSKLSHTAVLWGVYVRSAYRGRGIASKMVATLLEVARNLPRVHQVKLCVHTQNVQAKRIYLANGFESYGVEPDVLRVGDRFVAEELMRVVLR
jgi:RimJ/RimL family protein N-acetyltransferase